MIELKFFVFSVDITKKARHSKKKSKKVINL